jgi:integrase
MVTAMFSYALRHGLVVENPARAVSARDEVERDRFLSPDEIQRLIGALETAERNGAAWQAVTAVRLILATGLRKEEALGLRWSEVDFDRKRLVLASTKTGRSVRPLGRAAVAILGGIKAKGLSSEWVFPATSGAGHYAGLQKAWTRVRAAAGFPDVRIHDLRHTVAATAASSGASLLVVGRLLGHKKARSTERYAHLTETAVAAAADKVGEVLTFTPRKVSA